MTLKCRPSIRKVFRDNADQLYLESQVYTVYDSYHVIICHYCQKYGHIAKKCSEKKLLVNPQPVENVLVHRKHETVVQQKRNASSV